MIGYLSARVVYEHLATKTMRFNGYLGNSPLIIDLYFCFANQHHDM
ncbi:hypothetical protein D3OALGA1CA_5422 [Olavius algarvensis associated proteobacterium Delta 3]|nr:hypothetical protein D3OALGA1CA_5422 [Olavius algarvensis associated proteobacterium Delta 3]